MKKSIIASLSILLSALSVFGAVNVFGGKISPGIDVLANEYEMTLSAVEGEEIKFTPDKFKEACGTENISEVIIMSVPDNTDGKLYLYDTPVMINQIIPSEEISQMVFVPEKASSGTSFRFSVNEDYIMTCKIVYSQKENTSPVCNGDININTIVSTVCGGKMTATDADGDDLKYEVTKYPENGTFIYERKTGEFKYTPTNGEGTEKVVFRAVDSKGAYSESAEIVINIIENKSGTVFSDMMNDTSATAAICMADKGIMTYSEEDGVKSFTPDLEVSRLEFLVAAMNIFGAKNIPDVEKTSFEDDADIPYKYKGYVYSAEKLGIVSGIKSGDKTFFMPDRAVTSAEASVILNNVIRYEAKEVSDVNPIWASDAASAMNELGITVPENLSENINRSETAQMLYSLSLLLGV